MKKLGVLILLVLVISCKEESKLNYAIVSGKITNNFQKEIIVDSNDFSFSDVIKINDDGTFRDTLYIDKGLYYFNFIKRTEIYLEGGSELVINVDNSNALNPITFSGKGHEINKYISLKTSKLKELLPDENKIYELEEKAFIAKLETIKNSLVEILKSTEGISSSFEEMEGRNLDYFKLVKIENYKLYHGYLTKNNDYKPSESLSNGLNELKLDNDEDYTYSLDYKILVDLKIRKKAQEIGNQSSISNEDAYFKAVSEILNENVKNGLIFDYVRGLIEPSTDKKSLFDSFMKISTNQSNNDKMTKLYKEFEKLELGNPSPIFENYEDINGEKVSLADFKGKTILIAVWSSSFITTALPELKLLSDIKSKYSVEIVNISLDAEVNKDKWKEAITSNNLVGVQLRADKSWKSDFAVNYRIKMVPRFILVDGNGVIINSNAPKPSNPGLGNLLSGLNI